MQQKIEKFRLTKTVVVKQHEHANLDSFSLRYGFVFEKDTELEIHCDPSTLRPDKNPKYKDRYSIIAKFVNPINNRTERGVFYLINNQNNKYYNHDKVVTIIRYLDERETEHHLTEVIRALRESNDITYQELINLHPLYMTRQLSTHADLIRILAEKKSTDETNNELNEYIAQEYMANKEGSVQTLEGAKTLVEVNTNVMRGKSSCTELVMEDGTRLHMKTISFDKNLQVTAKAKLLVGRKVKTSCWDPIGQHGRFSSKGYFRNLYALSDEDLY